MLAASSLDQANLRPRHGSPDNGRTAIAGCDICHRELEFEYGLRRVGTRLLQLFEIRRPQNYQAVMITGSGGAPNEATMLSSVVDG